MNSTAHFEIIVVGGSYAGLSAAMALGRSLRSVLLIDSGLPCNRYTPHAHNFITHDGVKPSNISEQAKSQVLNYPSVTFIDDVAIQGVKSDPGFRIFTKKGKEFTAKKLIFATGIKDTMPDIYNFSSCWGISVVHCPYCHGYEIRHKKTAIISNGEQAMHLASLVLNLTKDLVILTSGKANFNTDQILKLTKNNITLIEKEVAGIEHENGYIKNVVFKDNSKEDFHAAYASLPFTQSSDIPDLLGCQLNEQGLIKVDGMQKTTVDGVFACGDNSLRARSIANAVSTGNMAGAMANMELAQEEF
ncbi:NAD(P)/FAD-dependent oxidoreductase [Zobellia galactanivorans]|uniref:Thioredoxin reductase n=1 Tax=Zobellia galactanivorans (strain DSM 12802 / CCUG 47099 / CIP 106680 / NCIMB 13871 / Dsij) TaxID=63186 RepID=G0L332_ZOBGA|nr:NAD(P)/FAD-dependent oxidoreductase [Zobellia galactanivorans]CAZ98356.1 Thioredoxin reductase [Zobellia galactanivorans]